jgi:hypothetical protein
MRNNIIALWMVHGENYPDLMGEAKADAEAFGIELGNYELQLIKCAPIRIEHGRVEEWRGWAVITWGFVEPQLLLSTVIHEEGSICSGLSSELSSRQKQ